MVLGLHPRQLATLGGVAWLGLVLWRFQSVAPAESLTLVALGVLWVVAVTSASFAVGALVLRAVGLRLRPDGGSLLITLATGASVWMLWAAVLGGSGWLHPWPLLVPPALAALAGAPPLWRAVRQLDLGLSRRVWLPASFLALAAGVSFLVTLTPSPFYDQLHYHLAFPERWLRAGRIVTFPRNSFSFLPANLGLLYAYALAALGPWAAQLVHWWLGVLATAAVGVLGRQGGSSRRGWWAAAIFALTPTVLLMATRAGSDLGTTAFALVTWLVLLRPATTGEEGLDRSRWWLAGWLTGIAAGCKLSALATVVPAVFLVLALGGRRGLARRVGLAGLGFALALGPWLGRNLAATGNPTYPFLGAVWAKVGWHADSFTQVLGTVADNTGAVATVATLGTFHPQGDAGVIGPVYLALLPVAAWLAWRRRRRVEGWLGLAGLVGVVGWAAGPLLGRYLVPVLGLLAPLAAGGLVVLSGGAGRLGRRAVTAAAALALAWCALTALPSAEMTRLAITLRRASLDELFNRQASYWPAVRYVNESLPPDARVLLVAEARSLYIERDVVLEEPFRTPLLAELAARSRSPEEIASSLRAMGVTHILYNRHEADRIALMTNRPGYPEPDDPRAAARLRAFLERCLQSRFRSEHVDVLALEACTPQ